MRLTALKELPGTLTPSSPQQRSPLHVSAKVQTKTTRSRRFPSAICPQRRGQRRMPLADRLPGRRIKCICCVHWRATAICSSARMAGHMPTSKTRATFWLNANTMCRYQVPFDFTPDLPGPFLHKVSGQSSWRFELPAWLAADSPASPTPAAITAHASAKTPSVLAPHLAARLSDPAASAQGIRYDKHRKTYVDTAEGTVMVGKNADGEYQQTFASELKPSGERVEQIPGSNRWRRKVANATNAAEPTPTNNRRPAEQSQADESGPSKRPHLTAQDETALPHQPDDFNGDHQPT